MELSVRFCLIFVLLFCAFAGWLVNGVCSSRGVDTQGYKSPIFHQTITGHLQILRHCRRQLTFIASVALGAFITRVIKESPLTPLPLPPLKDPPRWTFLTLPLHLADPYLNWMQSQVAKPQKLYQNFEGMPQSWHLGKLKNSIDDSSWRNKHRFRRDLSGLVKSSPTLIANTVAKILGSLKICVLRGSEY